MDKQTKIFLTCLVVALAVVTISIRTQHKTWAKLTGLGIGVVIFPVVPILASVAQARKEKQEKKV